MAPGKGLGGDEGRSMNVSNGLMAMRLTYIDNGQAFSGCRKEGSSSFCMNQVDTGAVFVSIRIHGRRGIWLEPRGCANFDAVERWP